MRLAQSLSVILLAFLVFEGAYRSEAFAQNETQVEQLRADIRAAEMVPAEPGERCLASGQELPGHAQVRIVRGRRLPLMPMDSVNNDLLADPLKYFSKIQPKGALFAESVERQGTDFSWLFVGFAALFLLASGGLAGAAAVKRGLDPGEWFFQGLFGNIFAVFSIRGKADLLDSPPAGHTKQLRTPLPEECKKCGAENHPAAVACGACGSALAPQYKSEAQRAKNLR